LDGRPHFVFLVPWLVLGGTVLFVLEPTLARRGDGGTLQHNGSAPAFWPLPVVTTLAVAL
jgi:hypothetical protein